MFNAGKISTILAVSIAVLKLSACEKALKMQVPASLAITQEDVQALGADGAAALEVERQTYLALPLVKGNFGDFPPLFYNWADFPGANRTAQYGINLPTAPYFHPYNPTGDDDTQRGDFFGTPQTVLSLKFPQKLFYHRLPLSVRTKLGAYPETPRENIVISVVTQTVPWQNLAVLFRPHYLVFPNAPERQQGFDQSSYVWPEFFAMEKPVTITQPPKAEFGQENGYIIQVHTRDDPLVISSPDNMPTDGILDGANPISNSFWSVVYWYGYQCGVTLHWILSDEEQAALSEIVGRADLTNIKSMLHALQLNLRFADSPKLEALQKFICSEVMRESGVVQFLASARTPGAFNAQNRALVEGNTGTGRLGKIPSIDARGGIPTVAKYTTATGDNISIIENAPQAFLEFAPPDLLQSMAAQFGLSREQITELALAGRVDFYSGIWASPTPEGTFTIKMHPALALWAYRNPAAYDASPEMLRLGPGAPGHVLRRDVPMGVFAPNGVQEIGGDDKIAFGTTRPLDVNLHDNRTLPDNAQFRIEAGRAFSSFWLVGVAPDRENIVVSFNITANTAQAREALVAARNEPGTQNSSQFFKNVLQGIGAFSPADQACLREGISTMKLNAC